MGWGRIYRHNIQVAACAVKMYRLFTGRLRTGCLVSIIDLFEICSQYSARLNELRWHLIPRGWCIDCLGGKKGVNYFTLIRLEESEYHKKWLKKHQQ